MKKFILGVLLASMVFTCVPVMAEGTSESSSVSEAADKKEESDIYISGAFTYVEENIYPRKYVQFYLRDRAQNDRNLWNVNVEWSVEDSSIATVRNSTVDSSGDVLGIKPGKTVLKAKYNGETYSIPITVHRYQIVFQKNASGVNYDGKNGKAELDKVYLVDTTDGNKKVEGPVNWDAVENSGGERDALIDKNGKVKPYDSGIDKGSSRGIAIESDGSIHFIPNVSFPAEVIGVQAQYNGDTVQRSVSPDPKYYLVKIDNGIIMNDPDAKIPMLTEAGGSLRIYADEISSTKDFDHWEVVSGGVKVVNPNKIMTSFVVPNNDVEVRAVYKSSNGSRSDASSDTSTSELISEIERLQRELSSEEIDSDTAANLQKEIEDLKVQAEKQTVSEQKIKSLEDEVKRLNAVINGSTEMYRLYNPNSGEHFYTASADERNRLVESGWTYENVAWKAPKSGTPVYRLYNPNTGDHHYTANAGEKTALVHAGWKDEGVGWYSPKTGKPVYREYNPNAKTGAHNYTTSRKENNYLVSLGWKYEGIGWYAE